MVPLHPNLIYCVDCYYTVSFPSDRCPACHAKLVEKVHAGEKEPIGSPDEEARVERNLGPATGSLPIDLMIKFQRGRARNGRVFHLNKSLQ